MTLITVAQILDRCRERLRELDPAGSQDLQVMAYEASDYLRVMADADLARIKAEVGYRIKLVQSQARRP